TQDLSVGAGGLIADNNVTFTLRERELRCLIGPNGAGKSTFFKSVTGQLRGAQSSGRVMIRGQDITGWRTHHIVRLGVGVKTQVPSVLNGLSVQENLWLAARRTLGRDGADAAVDEVLAGKPWLVLLDEPAAGTTSAETERLVAIVKRINQSATVIVVD